MASKKRKVASKPVEEDYDDIFEETAPPKGKLGLVATELMRKIGAKADLARIIESHAQTQTQKHKEIEISATSESHKQRAEFQQKWFGFMMIFKYIIEPHLPVKRISST